MIPHRELVAAYLIIGAGLGFIRVVLVGGFGTEDFPALAFVFVALLWPLSLLNGILRLLQRWAGSC